MSPDEILETLTFMSKETGLTLLVGSGPCNLFVIIMCQVEGKLYDNFKIETVVVAHDMEGGFG